jgi:mannose-6-phosphate isomerase-like protein (cupin superfamily)
MATISERIENGLIQEGYGNVYTHEDAPGKIYADHTHEMDTAHIVVKGKIEITMGEKIYVLEKGDRCDVPADTAHSAHVSDMGCTYVIGER